MTPKDDTKFKGKLTRGLKNDIRNLVTFRTRSQTFENLHFDGFLCPKDIKFQMRKYKRVMSCKV